MTEGLLDAVPESAAEDNDPTPAASTYTGSYIWYVDDSGKVQALYTDMPDATGADSVIGGFQTDIFP